MNPALRAKFEMILSKVNRPGLDDLKIWLMKEGFYFAPASTKFHGSREGGLLEHSLNVYEVLKNISGAVNLPLEEESLILCALLHDVCKVGLYYFKDGRICYNSKTALEGHGKRSVEILKRFIVLKPHEEYAILMHMGVFGTFELGTYIKEYEFKEMSHLFSNSGSFLISGLHFADMIAAHFIDK